MRRQAVYDLLHRLDYSSLMPRPQHEQANPEVQEFFKEIVVEQIDAIAAAHPEEEIHTYFQDEARFGQKGTITRVWARRGSRPRAVRQTGFTSLYVLAAVCAATGAMSAVIMPTLNTEVVNLFLEQFSRELPAGVHEVLILDGAGLETGENVAGAQQCEPDPAAAVLAGALSGGEPVALLACASLVEPPVPGLRRVAGGGGQESVCGPRRHRNDQDRLQSSIYLKERMKLPEGVLLLAVFRIWVPQFLSLDNLLDLAKQISINAVLAFAMTLVILIGGIDLSVGAVVALIGTLAVWLLPRVGLGGAVLAGLVAATVFGAVNGASRGFSSIMTVNTTRPP